jgi:hypothetical protein
MGLLTVLIFQSLGVVVYANHYPPPGSRPGPLDRPQTLVEYRFFGVNRLAFSYLLQKPGGIFPGKITIKKPLARSSPRE